MMLPSGRRFGILWPLSLVIAVGSWAAAEQPGAAQTEQGRRIFQKYCAGCHGREGTGEGYRLLGADPANLMARQTQEKSDEDLLESIHEGQTVMPAWKDRLSNEDRRRVLAYIRTLAK